MRTSRSMLGALFVLLTATGAWAGAVIATPAVFAEVEHWCLGTNLNSTARRMTVELVAGDGTVLVSKSEDVEPGAVLGGYQRPSGGWVYCRFSGDGSPKKLRGAMYVYGAGGNNSFIAAQ